MQADQSPKHNLTTLLLSAVKSAASGMAPTAATILASLKADQTANTDPTGKTDSENLVNTKLAFSSPGEDNGKTMNNPFAGSDDDEPELPRFEVGEVVNGRYEILRILGEGSMGVVYRVSDRLFPSRRVALKTMQRVADAEWLALFRAEFRALSQLRHANIAEVYDFEELSGQQGHLFTMEFVEGQELSEALASRDIKRVWRVVTQMAEALAYVHSHGRLHLDIKPQNAMLASDGTCKLLDFGLVGLVFKPGQFAGTPMYMAPEILRAQVPDARADLFSLGITAYQLLTGSIPYTRTTGMVELIAEKLELIIEIPAVLHEEIPQFMRDAVRRLCSLHPEERFHSAKEFLDATRQDAAAYGMAPAHTAHRLGRSTFVGREHELKQVLDFAHARLPPSQGAHAHADAHAHGHVEAHGHAHAGLHTQASAHTNAMICCVGAPSGLGKSRLLAEARAILQSEGYVFLQGDAYDHDVGEYTALSAILQAAAHLAHAQKAEALIQQHGPEIVKIVPEFGLPIVCQPSPAFSNGEAERARLIEQTATFLLEMAELRPLAMYLNDLQWAGEGTVQVLGRILQLLKTRPTARLALLISYRSDQVQGQPVEKLLQSISDADRELVRLQPLTAEQVGAVMGSMLLATVGHEIAVQMQQATRGVPFFVEESTRWLISQGTLEVRHGRCHVTTASGHLDLQVEVNKGIVSRAALQGEEALLCLQLLAVCARPIDLAHLGRAMAEESAPADSIPEQPATLSQLLESLEAEQFVVAVAGNRPRWALAHDRIRESLFASLPAEVCSQLHARLGVAFEAFLHSTHSAELAILAAVHQNATPLPKDHAGRMRRCDVNLRAADMSAQAADFAQALTFLSAAEALLAPDIWAEHTRGMRLTYQRARTFGAMRRHNECQEFAKQAMSHAKNLVEEGQALVLALRALTMLARYDEVSDATVDFCNRLDPGAKLPKHPSPVHALADVVRLSMLLQRVGGGKAILARVNEQENLQRDILYEIITESGAATYLVRPLLFAQLARYGMGYLLREGVGSTRRGHAIFVVLTCTILLSAAGMVEPAIDVGKAAQSLIDSATLDAKSRTVFQAENYLRPLDEPLRRSPPQLEKAALFAKQARDTGWEGYALYFRILQLEYLGVPLDEVDAHYIATSKEPAVASSEETADWARDGQRWIAPLQRRDGVLSQMDSQPLKSKTGAAVRSAAKLRGAALGLLAGPYRAAEYGFPSLIGMSLGAGGMFFETIAHFYAGLLYLSELRGKIPLLDRVHFRAAAEFVIFDVRKHARYNPTDHSHRITCLEAEQLRTRGKLQQAVPLYEKAVRLAKENGWQCEAAVVLEKFSEVLIELGERQRAHTAASESLELYRSWQAWAKVKQMERVVAATGSPKN